MSAPEVLRPGAEDELVSRESLRAHRQRDVTGALLQEQGVQGPHQVGRQLYRRHLHCCDPRSTGWRSALDERKG